MPLELLPPDVLPPVVPDPVLLDVVPELPLEVLDVLFPDVPETILNAPSIDTLAVFESSICCLTSIFWTSRPVPSIVTLALVPTVGSRLKVCENLLPDEVPVDVPAEPPVTLEVLPPVVVLPVFDERELPVLLLLPVMAFPVLLLLLAPDVELSFCVLSVLLPVTALNDLLAFCNEF